MRHQKKTAKLGMLTDHRNLMLRNLATSVILYESVRTTEARAKAVCPIVDRLIATAVRKPEAEAIREINSEVLDKNASRKLIKELKPRFAERKGGYTRITKLGHRDSDAAAMAQIELV